MSDPECTRCPPSLDLDAFIDVCTDTTDDGTPPPAKRAKVDPKVFVHVSQDVLKWAEGMEIIRYNKQLDPALKRKQVGDLRVRKDGFKSTFDGRLWRIRCQEPDCPSSALGDGQGGKAIYCIKHGGGPRCQEPDCPSAALGDCQGGKAVYCITHGGGGKISKIKKRSE